MQQLTIDFAHRLARSVDPATSKKAAARVKDFSSTFCAKIYEELKKRDGTFEELAARTGLRPDQVWRRLPDLQKMGLAIPTNQERAGQSGRAQRVWAVL
jgi:predicted ArsR family transcriptional regulator